MISDVLCEAAEEIRRYMTDPTFARCYVGIEDELNELLRRMDRVRQILDAPVVLGDYLPKLNGGQHGPTA